MITSQMTEIMIYENTSCEQESIQDLEDDESLYEDDIVDEMMIMEMMKLSEQKSNIIIFGRESSSLSREEAILELECYRRVIDMVI